MRRIGCILVLTAGVAGLAGPASAELLFNPGFEDVDNDGNFGDGWGSFGAAGFNAFFGDNGHASLFLDQDGNSGGVFQTGIAGDSGVQYDFELTDVFIQDNAEGDVLFGLEYYAADDATKLGETLQVLDLDNPDFDVTGTAVAGTAFVRPIISFSNSVGTPDGDENIFVFDASLTVVPEPASLALIGIGSLLMLGRRRGA